MNKKQKQNIIGLIVLAVVSSILGRLGSNINPYIGYIGSGFALAFALLAFINVNRVGKR